MDQQAAIAALRNFDVEALRQGLAEGASPDNQAIERTTQWICAFRDEVVRKLEDIDQPEDVELTVAVAYIELKSQWIAFNSQINYQMIKKGAPNPDDQQRGFAVYSLICVVEGLLNDSDVEQITAFLAEPLASQG